MLSTMAATLLVNAFDRGDFTGWGEPEDVGGMPTYRMPLSADGGIHMWSVIAEQVHEARFRYTLVVEYRTDRVCGPHFKFPIYDVDLNSRDAEHPRLVATLHPGENIVLDCINRPVYKPTTPPVEESDMEGADGEEEVEYEGVDDPPKVGLGHRFAKRKGSREEEARRNLPPRPRMGFRRGGNGSV